MLLQHIKNDVYHLIGGDYLDIFLSEQELRQLITYNEIADVIKTPLGWYVNHDIGLISFKQYLKVISQSALELLSIVILNDKTNQFTPSNN